MPLPPTLAPCPLARLSRPPSPVPHPPLHHLPLARSPLASLPARPLAPLLSLLPSPLLPPHAHACSAPSFPRLSPPRPLMPPPVPCGSVYGSPPEPRHPIGVHAHVEYQRLYHGLHRHGCSVRCRPWLVKLPQMDRQRPQAVVRVTVTAHTVFQVGDGCCSAASAQPRCSLTPLWLPPRLPPRYPAVLAPAPSPAPTHGKQAPALPAGNTIRYWQSPPLSRYCSGILEIFLLPHLCLVLNDKHPFNPKPVCCGDKIAIQLQAGYMPGIYIDDSERIYQVYSRLPG